MHVLVAGGGGFLGSAVCEELLRKGHRVRVIDNFLSSDRKNLREIEKDIELVVADIRDAPALVAAGKNVDVVIHLAFPTPLATRDLARQFYDVASTGTANLLELALRNNAWFLYGSSISVYGKATVTPITEAQPVRPMLLYAANKLHGENLCAAFGQMQNLPYRVLRYSDLYGPRDRRSSAVNNFLRGARDGTPMRVSGGGKQRRTYTFVRDAAVATELALRVPPSADVVNVASDTVISIQDLAELIRAEIAPSARIESVPGPQDERDYVFSGDRFRQTIGAVSWTPLREGLRSTLASLAQDR